MQLQVCQCTSQHWYRMLAILQPTNSHSKRKTLQDHLFVKIFNTVDTSQFPLYSPLGNLVKRHINISSSLNNYILNTREQFKTCEIGNELYLSSKVAHIFNPASSRSFAFSHYQFQMSCVKHYIFRYRIDVISKSRRTSNNEPSRSANAWATLLWKNLTCCSSSLVCIVIAG